MGSEMCIRDSTSTGIYVISNATSRRFGFFGQGVAHDNPLWQGAFTFLGVAFVVVAAAYYAVRYFTDRRATGTERDAADSL